MRSSYRGWKLSYDFKSEQYEADNGKRTIHDGSYQSLLEYIDMIMDFGC